MVKCDICNQDYSVLLEIDFKNIVWKERDKYQLITENNDLKRTTLELCHDCVLNLFRTSRPCITFNLELFHALGIKEELKSVAVKQITINTQKGGTLENGK